MEAAVEQTGHETIDALRAGDETAFRALVERYHGSLLCVAQRAVISLRDVEGWSSVEVCNALEISETNQRVLLHRARAKGHRALEESFEKDAT